MNLPSQPGSRKKARLFAAYRLPAETKAEITRISHRRFYLNEDVRRSESNVIIAALALLSPSYPEGRSPAHPKFTPAKMIEVNHRERPSAAWNRKTGEVSTHPSQKKPVSASVRQPYMKPGGKLV